MVNGFGALRWQPYRLSNDDDYIVTGQDPIVLHWAFELNASVCCLSSLPWGTTYTLSKQIGDHHWSYQITNTRLWINWPSYQDACSSQQTFLPSPASPTQTGSIQGNQLVSQVRIFLLTFGTCSVRTSICTLLRIWHHSCIPIYVHTCSAFSKIMSLPDTASITTAACRVTSDSVCVCVAYMRERITWWSYKALFILCRLFTTASNYHSNRGKPLQSQPQNITEQHPTRPD